MLVLAGCDKGNGGDDDGNGDGGGETIVDHRGRVAGVYPVRVNTPMTGVLYTDMTLAKEGEADLMASATVEVPYLGKMNIDLVFSELEEYEEQDGRAVTGYLFKIAEQELGVGATTLRLKGTGAYDGYDGRVYKNADTAFVSFEIGNGDGTVKVKIETGVYVDNRGKVAGTYPVKLTATMVGDLYADLVLTVEGENELKASGTAQVPSMPWIGEISVELILSELKEFDEQDGQAVTGYYFIINGQEFSVPILGDLMLSGVGTYDGYDGKVYKNATDSFIGLKVASEDYVFILEVETVDEE